MEDSQQKDALYSFWGNDTFPSLMTHEFMSENLRVNIWRDNFTSDYVRVNLPSENIKSDLSKLSTLSEPSIVKFIENQSEHFKFKFKFILFTLIQ